MNTNLSTDLQQMILDNRNLVHHLLKILKVHHSFSEYDDMVSIGTIGLIKAAKTFDKSQNIVFSNYACICIKNEIFRYYNKNKKYLNDISLENFILYTQNDTMITLQDKLEHPDSNFVEKIIDAKTFAELINIILNCLNSTEKLIMLYRIGNLSQSDISKIFNFSQSYVSRLEKKSILKIREAVNNQSNYTEIFSMNTIEDYYKITVFPKDINNFKKIFPTILQNLSSTASINFKINYIKNKIIFNLPRQPESFPFLAQIIQEFENNNIAFSSPYS